MVYIHHKSLPPVDMYPLSYDERSVVLHVGGRCSYPPVHTLLPRVSNMPSQPALLVYGFGRRGGPADQHLLRTKGVSLEHLVVARNAAFVLPDAAAVVAVQDSLWRHVGKGHMGSQAVPDDVVRSDYPYEHTPVVSYTGGVVLTAPLRNSHELFGRVFIQQSHRSWLRHQFALELDGLVQS